MDEGRIKEYGSPYELLNDGNTLFYAMCKDAGITNGAHNK